MYMKKALAFALAAIIMVVSCLPCADAGAFSKQTATTIAKASSQIPPHSDVCPPFCQCQCCSVVSINHSFQIAVLPVAQYLPPFSSLISPEVVNLPHAVWQPPQLAVA